MSLAAMTVLFGLLHLYQGVTGMVLLTGVTGLTFGLLFLATGRNLWVTIIAHGTMDTVAFLLLFSATSSETNRVPDASLCSAAEHQPEGLPALRDR